MTDPATEDNPILATIAKKIADTARSTAPVERFIPEPER